MTLPGGSEKRDLVEDVLDEILSFNFRSLRTLRDILIRPGAVAARFVAGDRDTYTPPMRVWFGALTWMFLLSIIWGGWGQVLIDDAGQLERLLQESGRDPAAFRDAVSSFSALLYVPIEALLMLPGVFALRQMRREHSLIAAVQCYFIPVTAMTISSTLMLIAASAGSFPVIWGAPVNLLVFFFVASRVLGREFADNRGGTIGKSLLLTLVVFALGVLARLITFTASMFLALQTVPGAL